MTADQLRAKARELTSQARGIMSKAQAEGKALTPDEDNRVRELIRKAEGYLDGARTREKADHVGRRMSGARPGGVIFSGGKTEASASPKSPSGSSRARPSSR
jgi:hypothetical protein